jgi:acylphosphatase
MMSSTLTIKHLVITGRVQGVGYRHFMSRTAHDLHVTGWVRNRHDGSVEAVLAGTSEAVHAMIEHARRGPQHATVTDVTVAEAHGSFERFDTLPTV